MKIVWAEPAEQDLDTIVEHIAKDKLQAALDMDDLLRDCADGLALFPKKGKPGRVPGTREIVAHKNYIMVYVVTSDAVQIVAVLHAARLWPPAKQEELAATSKKASGKRMQATSRRRMK
jgi:addiction module RelE/StbE family toxin